MNLASLKGSQLIDYLKANKTAILKDKLSNTEVAIAPVETAFLPKATVVKESAVNKDTLDVRMVCSTSWFFNGNYEVLTDKAYTASIATRGNSIPHIVDHNHSATAHVGDTTKVYTETMSAKDLGASTEQQVTALVMESTVRRDYNPDVFKFYANGKINQHSIGYLYKDVKIAVNSKDPELKDEKAVWDANYDKIVNKDKVSKAGFFFLVDELDILENSAVLFGANSLTPTLSVASLDNEVISSLGNVVNDINQPSSKGEHMTLEEAQGKIASLTAELASVKAEQASVKTAAALEERTRTVNIIKAASTFGIAIAAAEKFIEKGSDIETVTVAFETIKEAAQSANHVDTSSMSFNSASNKEDFKENQVAGKLFTAAFDKALEAKQLNPFEGVI